MSGGANPRPRAERLSEFYRRLGEAAPAGNHDDALRLLAAVLNAVEDEWTDIPYNPDAATSDGRMYPPDEQFFRPDESWPGVRCYFQRGHLTLIADNGAIEIRRRRVRRDLQEDVAVECVKEGQDGRRVSDYGNANTSA